MCLRRFGSDELKKEFLIPSITGDKVACLGISEVGAGSDVSSTFNIIFFFLAYGAVRSLSSCIIIFWVRL